MGSLRRRGANVSSSSSTRGFTPLGEVESDASGVLISARSAASGALVDIRVLAPALKADRAFMRRLGGAMETLRELRHTNLVSVMQFDRRAAAVVYESVPGSTLTQLLEGQGQLELAASLVLLEDCISGLEALHNTGVVHGNLTTDAVVVETTGAVLLRDAGLSHSGPAGLLSEQRPFLAPEILHGAVPTAATDLYAATAVFVESIGGRASKAAVRKDLRPLLSEGMAKDPSERSAKLDDFRRELDDYARATIGESWRRDGRALLTIAASAHATHAIPVSAEADSSGAAADAATATVALLRTPGPRDRRILVGLGAVGLVALLAILVLVRGLNGPTGLASGFGLPSNLLPFIPGATTPSPSASAVGPAPTAGALTPGATIPAPIVGPTATPLPPTPKPNPALLSQTITWTSTLPSGEAYGGSYLPTASGGASGNRVVFGSLTTSVCKLGVGNTFDFVGVGTCVIDATQGGNSRFNAAPPVERSISVGQASQVISITSSRPSNPTYLGTYTATASANGGTVVFSADPSSVACSVSASGAVALTAAGTCVIDANQAGNPDYLAAPTSQLQFDVANASVTFTSTSPCNPCIAGSTYTLTASATPGVTVAFAVAPSPAGACTIAGNTVTFDPNSLLPGSCVIQAVAANGDPQYETTDSQTITAL